MDALEYFLDLKKVTDYQGLVGKKVTWCSVADDMLRLHFSDGSEVVAPLYSTFGYGEQIVCSTFVEEKGRKVSLFHCGDLYSTFFGKIFVGVEINVEYRVPKILEQRCVVTLLASFANPAKQIFTDLTIFWDIEATVAHRWFILTGIYHLKEAEKNFPYEPCVL